MELFDIKTVLFNWYFFSVSGWVLETIQESIVRRRFVSKGFFRGPYVPCHGLGGLAVHMIGSLFRSRPALVFVSGMAVCTVVEYLVAVFLKKCFAMKCWDYATYPHTRWCHFQGRICLTISLFFGFVTLAVVYVLWDSGAEMLRSLGPLGWPVIGVLYALFAVDAVYTCRKMVLLRRAGVKVKGWAAFSDTETPE